jgi:hypothetical protein
MFSLVRRLNYSSRFCRCLLNLSTSADHTNSLLNIYTHGAVQIPVKVKLMFLLQDQNLYGVYAGYRSFHYYFLGYAIFLVLL